MMRRWQVAMVVLALVSAPTSNLWGQGGTVVRDLLNTARDRLHDLRFKDADSIARAVLEFPNLRRIDRIRALHVMIGASYPDQESAQDRDRAIDLLRDLVRYAPEQALARDVSWDGLDSLYRTVRRQTFGVSAIPRPSNVLVGQDGRAMIDVNASRPARFFLSAHTGTLDRVIPLDSTDWIETGSLRLSAFRDGKLLIPIGPFELLITAVDSVWADTLQYKYAAVLDAPALLLGTVPTALDSAALVPELTKPRRAGGIIGGLFALAGTIVASQVIRETAFKSTLPRDNRATSIGIAIGLGAGAGVWLLDKGAPISKNVEANRETRRLFQVRVDSLRAENRKRVNEYRVEVRINPEPQPQ